MDGCIRASVSGAVDIFVGRYSTVTARCVVRITLSGVCLGILSVFLDFFVPISILAVLCVVGLLHVRCVGYSAGNGESGFLSLLTVIYTR